MEKTFIILQEIKEIIAKYPRGVWFRGVGSAKYSLIPGLFRHDIDNPTSYEKSSYNHFISLKNSDSANLSPIETLMKMQHYGIRTRLLDWSENLLVALHFAIINAKSEDAAIWILSPFDLNNMSIDSPKYISTLTLPEDMRNYESVIMEGRTDGIKTIAFYPPMNNERITVQSGKFTIHGDDKPLEVEYPALLHKGLHKVTIPTVSWASIRQFLGLCDVNEARLYPELDKACGYIHTKSNSGK